MFNRLLSIMTTSQTEAAIINAGFKGDENLKQRTAEAKARMALWGRKPILEGGEFHRNNNVLNGRRQVQQQEGMES